MKWDNCEEKKNLFDVPLKLNEWKRTHWFTKVDWKYKLINHEYGLCPLLPFKRIQFKFIEMRSTSSLLPIISFFFSSSHVLFISYGSCSYEFQIQLRISHKITSEWKWLCICLNNINKMLMALILVFTGIFCFAMKHMSTHKSDKFHFHSLSHSLWQICSQNQKETKCDYLICFFLFIFSIREQCVLCTAFIAKRNLVVSTSKLMTTGWQADQCAFINAIKHWWNTILLLL